jgi:ABC-type glycerol-3-phosphate transport system substrate-binding protein
MPTQHHRPHFVYLFLLLALLSLFTVQCGDNKQVFADYNLQPPQTWDEFITICETLRANGETPLAISGNEPWASYVWFEYLNLRLNGPAFHRGLLTGKEHFDNARVRTVLETWRSLFTNGYYVEKPQALGSLNAVAALVRNERAKVLTREKNGQLSGE